MRYREILEACWSGYQQQGMKKKGDRMVPNCVPVSEQEDQKFAIASHPIPGDKFRLTINNRPFILTPGGFGKQHSQIFLDSFYLTDMKSGKTEFVDSWWNWPLAKAIADHLDQNYADALVRIGKADFDWHEKNNDWDSQPPRLQGIRRQTSLGIPAKDFVKSVDAVKRITGQDRDSVSKEQMEEDLRKWFKEKWVRFGPDGRIRGDCARGSEKEGKPKCLPQAKAHALGKKGRASAAAKKRREDPNPERRGPARNVATKVKEDANPKFAALIKNIQTRLKKDDYQRPELMKRVAQMVQQADPTVQDAMTTARELVQQYGQGPVEKQTNVWDLKAQARSGNLAAQLPKTSAGTPSYAQQHATFEDQLDEKQDACYRKVKSRYKVWPSAYASGALVQCRKKGAANWGNKGKK